jgi:hypothetical protein
MVGVNMANIFQEPQEDKSFLRLWLDVGQPKMIRHYQIEAPTR